MCVCVCVCVRVRVRSRVCACCYILLNIMHLEKLKTEKHHNQSVDERR